MKNNNDKTTTILIILYFTTIFIFFITANYNILFVEKITETSDLAVNALDIRDAKQLDELYGNYSRWKFSHPGPAFFYIYAAGEYILYDYTQIVSSPFSSHIITSVLLQLSLAAISIQLLSKYIVSTNFIGVILIIFSIHFGLIGKIYQPTAFASIWPPMVLLGPTLCFLVGSVALSSGIWTSITFISTTFCAGLLIHGHVAQVLFVIPVLTYVVLKIYQNYSLNLRRLLKSKIFYSVALLIIIFAMPIIIDLFYMYNSNFIKYLKWIQNNNSEIDLISAIVYMLSFFTYNESIKSIIDQNSGLMLFHKSNFFINITLLFIIIFTYAIYLFKRKTKLNSYFPNSFNNLWSIIVIYLMLTFIWCNLISGGYHTFNLYYFFGIIFLIWIAIVSVIIFLFIPKFFNKHVASLTIILILLSGAMIPKLNLKSDIIDKKTIDKSLSEVSLP